MKFRKKPVVVEAIQFTEDVAREALFNGTKGPFGLSVSGDYHPAKGLLYRAWVVIKTLEGETRAGLGVWIIRGAKGELYPCEPDIFAATYEPAECEIDPDRVDEKGRLLPPSAQEGDRGKA